jgi:iron complex outermembrane receptor protein
MCVVLLAALAMSTGAQQPPPDLTTLSIEELTKIRVDTVFGASKFQQKVTDAPASVSIVTAAEIRQYGYRTLAEILRSVRGFYVNYDRNYSYVGVRGFARPGDYNTRILLLVDGHRMNDNIYDQALIGTEFPMDIDLIERVELIRGPSSSLYGTNAFFAVVNVITKRGASAKGLEVSVEAASFGSYKGRVSYGLRTKRGLELFVSGSFYDSAGQQRLYFPEFDFAATNDGFAYRADDDQYAQFLTNISFHGLSFQSAYGSREKGIPTASFGTVFNDPRTRTRDTRWYADLKYERQLGDQLGVAARLSYDRYYYSGSYIYDNSGTGVPLFEVNKDFAYADWWGTEVLLTKTYREKHKVTFGSEFRNNLRQDQKNYDQSTLVMFLDDKRRSTVVAVYGQNEYRICSNLILNVGLRFDHYSTFGGSTNPRVGLIYRPAEKTTLKFLYGQAFRAPNVFEMFYTSGTSDKANPSLQPESIKTGEVTVEQYFGEHIRMSASAYRYWIKGLITQTTDPLDGRITYLNLGRVETEGLGMELEGKWARGFGGRASYSFQGVQDGDTGAVLSNSPRHLGKVNFTIPLAPRKIIAGMEIQYASKVLTLAGTYQGSSVVSNVTLSSAKFYRGFDFSFGVYNVFNARWYSPGAQEHQQNVIRQDGRNFRLQIRFHR